MKQKLTDENIDILTKTEIEYQLIHTWSIIGDYR